MVVFGAPEKLKSHENQAVECSLKMNNQLKELNIKWMKISSQDIGKIMALIP